MGKNVEFCVWIFFFLFMLQPAALMVVCDVGPLGATKRGPSLLLCWLSDLKTSRKKRAVEMMMVFWPKYYNKMFE